MKQLASPRLMLVGCAWLGAALVLTRIGSTNSWIVLAPPLALLAVNLAAAIAIHPALRRGGLGVFHGALLALLLVAALGRLTHFEGRVEIADGGEFDADAIDVQSRGPWHRDGLAAIHFAQTGFVTDYSSGVKRDRTHAGISVPARTGQASGERVAGDDTPLVLDGYRFYTTHNKGFAPVVTWHARGAVPITGALHLPSYPQLEHRQQVDWTPPGGPALRLWLRLAEPLDESHPWRLDPAHTAATLIVHAGGERAELAPGAELPLDGGTLRFERLGGWMGYRIYYDPTLPWLLVLAVTATLGLAWHAAGRLDSRARVPVDDVGKVTA